MNTVTGTSESRLLELKKYAVSGGLDVQFFTSNDQNVDGLDLNLTVTGLTESLYVYYLGKIKYFDHVVNGITSTTFEFISLGLDDPNNFDNLPIIKLESKQNMVENPQVDKDVFIERQRLPVFEKNYRLRAVNSLNDVISYAGGNYFTIYNNT
jgi:hypothetical protein